MSTTTRSIAASPHATVRVVQTAIAIGFLAAFSLFTYAGWQNGQNESRRYNGEPIKPSAAAAPPDADELVDVETEAAAVPEADGAPAPTILLSI
jgi:hypothetical protein